MLTFISSSTFDCATTIPSNVEDASLFPLRPLDDPRRHLPVRAVDGAGAGSDPGGDPALAEIGRDPREVERHPDVVDVLGRDAQRDHPLPFAQALARTDVRERLRARARDEPTAVAL